MQGISAGSSSAPSQKDGTELSPSRIEVLTPET